MIGTIRKCSIFKRGGILAATLVAAVFATSQVTCLTHTHCEGADCFEHQDGSQALHDPGHADHEADSGYGQQAGSCCEDDHQDHDIHHHSLDGKNHPKRRFTALANESEYADAVSTETPAFTLAAYLPATGESPPLERYGLIFAERAPPFS